LNTLHHAANHCNTLQNIATYCNALHHTAPHYKIQQDEVLTQLPAAEGAVSDGEGEGECEGEREGGGEGGGEGSDTEVSDGMGQMPGGRGRLADWVQNSRVLNRNGPRDPRESEIEAKGSMSSDVLHRNLEEGGGLEQRRSHSSGASSGRYQSSVLL